MMRLHHFWTVDLDPKHGLGRCAFASKIAFCISAVLLVVGALLSPGILWADACLMTYSTGPCEYRYSTTDFYTVGPGDPLYDPVYDRSGGVR